MEIKPLFLERSARLSKRVFFIFLPTNNVPIYCNPDAAITTPLLSAGPGISQLSNPELLPSLHLTLLITKFTSNSSHTCFYNQAHLCFPHSSLLHPSFVSFIFRSLKVTCFVFSSYLFCFLLEGHFNPHAFQLSDMIITPKYIPSLLSPK